VIDGRRSVVSYLAVDDGKYFVFFISDYGAFYQKTLDTTRTILYFCAGIFIVLLLVSILISYKVYLPINDIFTNIWRMIKGKRTEEQAADPNLRHAAVAIGIAIEQLNNREQDGSLSADRHKNGYFRKLLLSEELPGGEIDREIAGYLPGFCGACVFAAVFRVDDHKAFCTGNTEEAVTFQLNSIGGLLENLLAQYGCVAFAPALDHLVAYLKTTVDEPGFKSASADIRKACDTVRPLFNVSLTVGVSSSGGPVGADGLRAMYREAYGYTNYRLIYGPGLLFGNRTVTTSVEKMEKAYKAADSIAASVKDLPPALFEKKIDELFSIIRAYRYESIMDVMIQIGDSLLKIVDGLQPRSHSISGIGTERFRQSVRECESLQEIKALLMEQYACINELISALKNTGSGDLLEAAVKFIEANYGNPSLSAAMISDMLGITPQYFSRLFRRLTSVSFPDYIKNVRLERAKSLLLANPYISISRLCEKVGYNSPSYFSSSFVKEYGVPPSKYIQLTRQISSQADSDFPKGR
jgi:two-component system response regulator YesN